MISVVTSKPIDRRQWSVCLLSILDVSELRYQPIAIVVTASLLTSVNARKIEDTFVVIEIPYFHISLAHYIFGIRYGVLSFEIYSGNVSLLKLIQLSKLRILLVDESSIRTFLNYKSSFLELFYAFDVRRASWLVLIIQGAIEPSTSSIMASFSRSIYEVQLLQDSVEVPNTYEIHHVKVSTDGLHNF